jgi:hypothetical protein
MPDLTHDQLAALARTGASNREIVAALGRPMTDAERTTVDRARLGERVRRKTGKQAQTRVDAVTATEAARRISKLRGYAICRQGVTKAMNRAGHGAPPWAYADVVQVMEGARDRDKNDAKRTDVDDDPPGDGECTPGALREAKRRLCELQRAEREGALIPREDVLAERRMVAEVLSSDLLSLGQKLAGELAPAMTPSEVRRRVDAAVVAMMKRWKTGGTVDA